MNEPDYKELYLHTAHELERAIRILINAQNDCERMYVEGETETQASDDES